MTTSPNTTSHGDPVRPERRPPPSWGVIVGASIALLFVVAALAIAVLGAVRLADRESEQAARNDAAAACRSAANATLQEVRADLDRARVDVAKAETVRDNVVTEALEALAAGVPLADILPRLSAARVNVDLAAPDLDDAITNLDIATTLYTDAVASCGRQEDT